MYYIISYPMLFDTLYLTFLHPMPPSSPPSFERLLALLGQGPAGRSDAQQVATLQVRAAARAPVEVEALHRLQCLATRALRLLTPPNPL